MKVKSTKRMLLTSILALAMCFSMLVGTTFAWFTDSVTSANNIIKSGNLDIEVDYTLDGENWAKLDGATDLFQKGLWEPGHTEVVVLRVKNEGTLALKYTAQMNILKETIGKTKDGADIKLSDILTVSTLTQQANDEMGVGDIVLMLAYLGENMLGYEEVRPFDYVNDLGQAGILNADQELHAGDEHYLVVKVDMAETVGNEANHNGKDIPTIEFGINVMATQFTYEQDSFGSNYDANATYPEFITTADDLKAALAAGATEINAAGAHLGALNYGLTTAIVPEGKTLTISNAQFEGKSYGNKVNGTVVFENCTFTNTGAYSIHFDGGNGKVVFKNCTFEGWCSFGDTIQSVTMEDCTLKGNGVYAMYRFYQDATLTNCTIDLENSNTGDSYPEAISAVSGATVTMTGCTVTYCDYECEAGKIVADGVTVAESADYVWIKNADR